MSSNPYQPPPLVGTVPYYGPEPLIGPQRPGIITAIGVTSIVIAGMGLLINLIMFGVAGQFYAMSARNAPAPMIPGPAAPTAVQVGQTSGEYVAPAGLSSSDRAIVIDGLNQVRRISPPRREQLDALLADAGQRVILVSMNGITPERIATYVTSVEQMPSSSGPPSDIFVLGSGRLEVSDKNAAFFPTSGASVRTDGSSYTDASGTHLAATQINAVVGRAMQLAGLGWNSTQMTTFQQELRAPNQTLIASSKSVAQATAQVRSATVLPDGTIGITTNTASISISTTGQTVPGIMAISAPPPQFFGTQLQRKDVGVWVTATMLALALSVYLLICGILTVRNFSHARLLLLIYCGARILVALLASFAIYRMWSDPTSGGHTQSEIYAAVSGLGALGAAYPALLLAIFMRRSVREYFATPTVPRLY
jgi:hypothetical protein